MHWSLERHNLYCHGDCGTLAFAINELTGWDLVFSYDWPCSIELCPKAHEGGPHMLVRHPYGRLLDIDGLHDDPSNTHSYHDMIEVNGVNMGAWRAAGSFHNLTPSQVTADALALIASYGLG